MPKPFSHLTGNGCHTHLSLWNLAGTENLFLDSDGELGLSTLGYQFIGGVLNAAEALCAWSNPTVNSYKRLTSGVTLSGATWSPTTISYSGNNRTHTIRIPEPGRFELRLADGSTNPYFLQAAIIAAGLAGIEQQRDPGPRADNNSYTEPFPFADVRHLPKTLPEALHHVGLDDVFAKAFGATVVDSYIKLKTQEWQRFCDRISPWELENTLDC